MIETYPILGFAPDLPPDTKGALVASSAILPTDRGISSGVMPSAIPTFLDDSVFDGAVLTKIDGTQRIFAGAATKIQELVSGNTVVNRGTGSYHAASVTQQWSFAQFGDVSLAVNKGDRLQFLTTGSLFANASATAPKASIVVVVGLPNAQFVMLFDYDDGTNNYTDGIFWSALNDYTDWSPAIATQCGNVRLLDVNGKFTAAVPFRDSVVAFKKNAMYLGQYVGGAAVWSWQRISNTVGCVGKNAVVEANDVLYFADQFGLWMFDGSYPRPMQGALQKWWADNSATGDVPRFTWNKAQHRLWVKYTQDGSGYPLYLVYNMRSQLWTLYGSLLNGVPMFLVSENYAIAHGQFYTLSSANPPASSFYVAAHGSDFGMTTIKGVRPHWVAGPNDTASQWVDCNIYYGPTLRNILSASAQSASFRAPGVFDVTKQARYLSINVAPRAGSTWECSGMSVNTDFNPAGE